MSILFVLVLLGVLFLGMAMVIFVWAVRSGQFEDLEGEGERIFFDDEPLAFNDEPLVFDDEPLASRPTPDSARGGGEAP